MLAYGTPVMLSNKSRCHSVITIKLGLGTLVSLHSYAFQQGKSQKPWIKQPFH